MIFLKNDVKRKITYSKLIIRFFSSFFINYNLHYISTNKQTYFWRHSLSISTKANFCFMHFYIPKKGCVSKRKSLRSLVNKSVQLLSRRPIKTALKRGTPKEKQNSCKRKFEFIALGIYDAGVSVSGQLVGSVFVWALLWSHTPKYRIEKMSRRIWHLTCDYSTISSLIFGKNFLFKIQLFSVISCP